MMRAVAACGAVLLAALVAAGPARAQPATVAPPKAAGTAGLEVLNGRWARPDGGYVIAIRSVGADGAMQAMYFNPSPLPFAKAQATRDGNGIRASFELRAGGYDGSTYELTYDPASDRLVGVYYQAVAKQKFDVAFSRR